MRIGIDGRKIPEAKLRGPLGTLEYAKSLGMEGVFFRTILDVSPELDKSLIKEVKQLADELGLYLEAGLGKVNPYAIPETPEVRAIGEGDTLLGYQRMMEVCAEFDIRELWVSTAGAKPYRGRFTTDRFRTDVSWEDQLQATRRFMLKLRPIALDLGVHLNLETHEEITTFEIIRLIEAVGEDVVGIVFDTANVLMRGEHPIMAAKRIAPYVRQTHLKDAYVELTDGGAYYGSRKCGDGLIDFSAILHELNKYSPHLNLTFENDTPRSGMVPGRPHLIELYSPDWMKGHPDLTREELAAYFELAHDYTERIRAGEVRTWQQMNAETFEKAEALAWIESSRQHIEGICLELGIPMEDKVDESDVV
ncbi:sugar phosphate isomerase/epimerase family protein [Paenibacillus sp. PL91]|uniref:sugar phosphate isomerase/epimerase family protein n=1 Tax=Paenibacillus sp. PL91 TaxID=2729538 RepID=UPI00145E0D66|nr:sugar phosphate isomerase/epimerase family protein [Paenibacillus sp. PL91]MBC9205029.1 sugar phosphate isomerase/epimerase [Paenibacillus sp. PL91]